MAAVFVLDIMTDGYVVVLKNLSFLEYRDLAMALLSRIGNLSIVALFHGFHYFLLKLLEMLARMAARVVELILIDEAGDEKIDQCLCPECDIFRLNVGQCSTH